MTRLVDIGVESYKIAAALKGVVAQRLLRRICPHCRELMVGQVPDRLKKWFPEGGSLYRAVGCAECSNTGYRGRLAVEEVLRSNEEVERRIAANESVDRLNDAARETGMRSLWESGVQHVRQGETTIEELLRVLEAPSETPRTSSAAMPRVPTGEVPTVRPSRASAPAVEEEPGSGPITAPSSRRGTRHSVPPTFSADSFELVEDPSKAPKKAAARRVLLVEDEESLRRVMKDLLEREGFQVHEAADGVVALDEIDRLAPDLVVLDLNLPRLDGYGVLSHLRARPATQKLPVIVLTAKGDEDSEVRVFEYGASDYLTKPFRARALSARIHSLLDRKAKLAP